MERIHEIIATYARHGWRLRRALLKPETRSLLKELEAEVFEDALIEDSAIVALWFARPSHAEREAWELRLLSDTPYALFETFEADEREEDREGVRREIDARLSDFSKARPTRFTIS